MDMPRPGQRQTMLFSATFPKEIQKIKSLLRTLTSSMALRSDMLLLCYPLIITMPSQKLICKIKNGQ
ncbi:hypothetical protein Leryth_025806 [Lithospermum erythrorhizon]|nr:hypothetical protein Leryth_025806 [Lithospermum erythrorhizon]